MKRSEINHALQEMEKMIQAYHVALPPFCDFTPDDWKSKGSEYDEVRDNMLGWDITDFGLGQFEKIGFSLITLRNGNMKNSEYVKSYAEKLLFMQESQTAQMHYHAYKMEDIINKGGGNVLIRVYNSMKDGSFADTPVKVTCDGRSYEVEPGTQIKLTPGESITITQGMYHDFEVEKGTGPVLLGEVSMCNDDQTDNYFYDHSIGRFPEIEEDEVPYRYLCNEYPRA